MRRLQHCSLLFVLIIFYLFSFVSQTHAVIPINLLSENLSQWFDANSSATPDVNYFGAWVMRPVGEKLYLGLGRDVPDTVNGGGPLFVSFDGSDLTLISQLSEDNVNRMKVAGNKIYIPGHDPNGSWDAGNLYIYDTQTETLDFKRYRYPSMHFVDAAVTDENGHFEFTGLKPTAYQIKVIKPADFVFTTRYVGSNRDKDNNANSSGTDLACTTEYDHWGIQFTTPYTDNSFDAGLRTSAGAAAGTPTMGERDESFYTGEYAMGDLVWHDLDNDGIQDTGEPGVAGVRVELYTQDPYFPCAIHAWGIYVDPDTQEIFYNLGHLQKYGTTTNALNYTIRSQDSGVTWDVIHEQRPDSLIEAMYYARDFTKIGKYFYRSGWGSLFDLSTLTLTAPQYIAYSQDGISWSYDYPGELELVPDEALTIYTTYVSADDAFINFHNKLHQIDSRGHLIYRHIFGSEFISIPLRNVTLGGLFPELTVGYPPPTQRYNSTTTVGDDYLYALGDDQKVYVTTNLRNWAPVADFAPVANGASIISLVYWPERDWVVVSTAGANGSLYAFDHSEAIAEVMVKPEVNSGLTFRDADEPEVDLAMVGGTGEIAGLIQQQETPVATFSATLSTDCVDWRGISGGSDDNKAFISGLDDLECTSLSRLYVAKGKETDELMLCPGVRSLDQVSVECTGGVRAALGESVTVEGGQVTIAEVELPSGRYFAIDGSIDLGAVSYTYYHPQPMHQVKSTVPTAEACTTEAPASTPDLFQINSTPGEVDLFFTPVLQKQDRYFISYGTTPTAEGHGFELVNSSPRVITVNVDGLKLNTTYYFKVRAGNGCQPGDWSNILAVKSSQFFPSYRWSSLPKAVVNTIASRITPSSTQRVNSPDLKVDNEQRTRVELPSTDSEVPSSEQPNIITDNYQTTIQRQGTSFFGKIMNFVTKLFKR